MKIRQMTVIPSGSVFDSALPAVTGGPFPDSVRASVSSAWGPRTPITIMDAAGNVIWTTGPFHLGADFWMYPTCDLLAIFDEAKVLISEHRAEFGNWVRMETPDGWWADYFHLLDPSPLSVDEHVHAGDFVGHVDSTGFARGAHLHLAMGDASGPTDPIGVFLTAPQMVLQPVEDDVELEPMTDVQKVTLGAAAAGIFQDHFSDLVNSAAVPDGYDIAFAKDAPAGKKRIVLDVPEALFTNI